MNTLVPRASAIACLLMLAVVPLSGCVVPGGGYGYGGGTVGFADYYEPAAVGYGGWGAGYAVGPPRGDERRAGPQDFRQGPHAYRPAPASHRVPSIPSHSRGNDMRRG